MKRRDLAGRVVVVTGAAKGIGAATARLLAARGAELLLVDHSDAPGMLRLDVRDQAALRQLAKNAAALPGGVAAVINCAGVIQPGRIDAASTGENAVQLDTNLGGTINIARAFVPVLRRQGSGHLVFISSLAGVVPVPCESIYSATKFAVRGFALSLALELGGSGVAVSVVCPDSTRTRMLDIEAREPGNSLSFTNAPLTVDEVARAIVATLDRPRLEVTVPARRWWVRLLGANPWIFPWLHPLMDAQARRRKARYAAELEVAP